MNDKWVGETPIAQQFEIADYVVPARELAIAIGIKEQEAFARLEVMRARMASDPELARAWREVALQVQGNSIVTGVERVKDGTIQISIVPVVPGVEHLRKPVAAMFMRHAQDEMRKKVGDFELERVFGRPHTALALLRVNGIR